MTDIEIKKNAKEFAEFWKDKGYEKGQSQSSAHSYQVSHKSKE